MVDYRRLPGSVEGHWQWQERAACRGLQTAMFFHTTYERGDNRRRRDAAANAVCRRCPVIQACLRHALQVQEPHGVWGGLSAEERQDALRARRRAASVRGQPSG